MAIITLSKKGQIVLPSEIRRKYNLRQGDRFLVKEENGKITLQLFERHPLLGLRGTFKGETDLTQALLQKRRLERASEDNERV